MAAAYFSLSDPLKLGELVRWLESLAPKQAIIVSLPTSKIFSENYFIPSGLSIKETNIFIIEKLKGVFNSTAITFHWDYQKISENKLTCFAIEKRITSSIVCLIKEVGHHPTKIFPKEHPKINLLPWRAQAKQKRYLNYTCFLACALIFTYLFLFSCEKVMLTKTNVFEHKNQLIQKGLSKIPIATFRQNKLKLKKIKNLKASIILDKKTTRAQLSLLSNIANLLNRRLRLSAIMEKQKHITLKGEAKNVTAIHDYITRLKKVFPDESIKNTLLKSEHALFYFTLSLKRKKYAV